MAELPSPHDGWVTDTGRRFRAIYQAESSDGTALLMKFNVHHHNTIGWFPSHRVELTRTPARVVREPSAKTMERIRRAIALAEEAEPAPDTRTGTGEHPGHAGADGPAH